MNLTNLMKRNILHREISASECIKFSGSLAKSFGARSGKNDAVALDTLILASMSNSYVEGMSQLSGSCGQTVRNHLKDKDPDLLLWINHDLIATLGERGLLSKPMMVAIDWQDEMYYDDHSTYGVIGTKNSRGTNYAYEYATASIVIRDVRFAIAAIPVRKRSIAGMVSELLEIVHSEGIEIELLLMDGGFFSADLIKHLISANVPFITHAPKLRNVCNHMEVDKEYTSKSHRRRKGEQATFRVVSIYGKDKGGKTVLYVFATNTTLSPSAILKCFRKRWGIETGYRMIGKFLAKTTSRRHSVRLLYFYFAILLYNLWVLLNLMYEFRIIADVLRGCS
ncbi:MAG: transposase [Candidatus Thermoplasmatota archaeon]|nr:transposase [Candidatus Thermoplasmatota archaeon]MCL5889307.1 transposase [Candidatus Thermoplasmatota archaeon]